jgi:thiol-disulfide isomerase/thioredoxin
MKIIKSKSEIIELIENNDMILIYFSNINCNVCTAVKPKLIELLKKFPNIKAIEVEVMHSIDIPAQFNIFSVPAILLFIDGKEVIREIRYISLLSLEDKITRYYDLVK